MIALFYRIKIINLFHKTCLFKSVLFLLVIMSFKKKLDLNQNMMQDNKINWILFKVKMKINNSKLIRLEFKIRKVHYLFRILLIKIKI